MIASARGAGTALRGLAPGLITAIMVALAATFVSEHLGGPQMLYALFFGMAFNFLATDDRTRAGIDFAARQVLRIGVALLGARITFDAILGLGLLPIMLAITGVALTIAVGLLLSRVLGRAAVEGVLTGGAVAICGASAALAISAVLPRTAENQRFTLLTVVAVTALSTLAMIAYPPLVKWLGFDAADAGMFLGGTIHDVAQVVGAGYMISPEAAQTATVVKLLRVALLVPVVIVLAAVFRDGASPAAIERPPLVPGFLAAFVVIVVLNSSGWIPADVAEGLVDVSRWCLVTAIAALGVKTHFQQLAGVGWRPLALLVGETLFLGALILSGLLLLRA